MGKRLLVGATFRDAQEDQLRWLDTQLRFLNATTSDGTGEPIFDHVSSVNWDGQYAPKEGNKHGDILEYDSRDTKVISISSESVTGKLAPTSQQHIGSLQRLLAYFKENKENYDYFLFLDNDAFPIRRLWLDDLLSKMNEWNRDIAVVGRPEILEIRWHASVLFCRRSALDHLDFGLHHIPKADLMCVDEHDVGIGEYQHSLREKVWPLIRTNAINLHPVQYGVYFDMFYHHGFGGARNIRKGRNIHKPWDTLRWGRNMYSTQYINEHYPWQQHTADFMEDPSSFVSRLAGWSVDKYATF